MLKSWALNAKATARPPRLRGVAFSSVRPTASRFPKAPSYSAAYADRGLAPESPRMIPPINRANATEFTGILIERHHSRKISRAVERLGCEFCGMIAEILLAAGERQLWPHKAHVRRTG